jgi:hypothetical protein
MDVFTFVIAGLDPAIHLLRKMRASRAMDPRVKPADDVSELGDALRPSTCRSHHLRIDFQTAHLIVSHALAFPRRGAPGVCCGPVPPSKKRARGTPGARCTHGPVCKV